MAKKPVEVNLTKYLEPPAQIVNVHSMALAEAVPKAFRHEYFVRSKTTCHNGQEVLLMQRKEERFTVCPGPIPGNGCPKEVAPFGSHQATSILFKCPYYPI
jgi:hypothetical protein